MSLRVLSMNTNLLLSNSSKSSSPSLTTLTSHTKPKTTQSNKPVYPVFPDVSLKKLPFSKVEDTILKPSSLQSLGKGKFQEQNFTFYLSKPQINSISNSRFKNDQGKLEYRHQIQMRFSLLDTSCDQLDNFPPSACVKVNGKLCPLPNSVPSNPAAQSKRPALPVNITPLCKLSSTASNTITVTWAVEVGRAHTVSVYQVENLTHKELLEQLKAKGQRQPDYTKALIKEKLSDHDQEIATTSCKVTLACPLGKMRMNDPCRASTCDHLQCFDAQLYLMMNEKKPKWMCPVCNKPALMENLLIDGFFLELVRSSRLPPDEHEIVLHNDGTWDPVLVKKDDQSDKPKSRPTISKTVPKSQTASKRTLNNSIDCITLDDTEISEPSAKKSRLETYTSSDTVDIVCIDLD